MCHMDTTCMECIHNTFLIGRSMSVKLEKKKVGGRVGLDSLNGVQHRLHMRS